MRINKHAYQIVFVLAVSLSLSACFLDDNDAAEVNFRPVASSLDLVTQTEVAIVDQIPGSDPDGDTLTYTIDTEPQLGSLVVDSTGAFTYQPFDEVTGSDSFTYRLTDSTGLESSAVVSITIESLEVSFLDYSREAFNADSSDSPLLLNGRAFIDDSAGQSDYQDLVDSN